MKEYSLDKYKFYRHDNVTIAVSTYGGREVKGYAKVDPRDTFNEQFGKELAAARCNAKIAKKRQKHALKQLTKAVKALTAADEQVKKMADYLTDANTAVLAANSKVDALFHK